MLKKRVVVIANKWWECDPLLNVLLNDNARPAKELKWPNSLNYPRPRADQLNLPVENPKPVPRAVFKLNNSNVEIWCISDLMEHLPDKGKYQSSSEVKMKYLPRIFADAPVDLVIAFGTAGYPRLPTENGGVVIGSRIFIHNAHPNGKNPDSNWRDGPFDQIIESKIDQETFNGITAIETSPKASVLDRFLVPPLNAANPGRLLARFDYCALGTVNVTNYAEYAVTDAATVDAFSDKYNVSLARSVETTHGLIRKQSEAPFLFVSGITDRVGYFDEEVSLRPYAQNTVAAHNAGIVVAWMLPRIDRILTSQPI